MAVAGKGATDSYLFVATDTGGMEGKSLAEVEVVALDADIVQGIALE
ncbi:hypothetical protein GCM10027180_19300 [Microbulbifer echini]